MTPVHLPEELDNLIALTLGDNIERALLDPASPFSAMMIKAREGYIDAVHGLVHTDFHASDGMAQAFSLQAQARRYLDLCSWISDAMEAAGQAEDGLAQDHEEEAVELLKEQLYGRREDKPAFDA